MLESWYFQAGGRVCGPICPAELKAKAANGQITAKTPVLKITVGAWVEAGQVKGLMTALGSADILSPVLRPHIEGAMPTVAAAAANTAADSAAAQDYPLVEERSQAQATSDLQESRRPTEMAYELVCTKCGVRNTFMLKDEPSHAQCAQCEAEVFLPSIKVAHQQRKEQQRRRTLKLWMLGIAVAAVAVLLLGLNWILRISPDDPYELARKAVEKTGIAKDRIQIPHRMTLPGGTEKYDLYVVPVQPPPDWHAKGLLTEYLVLMEGLTVLDVREHTSEQWAELQRKYHL
jgi:hypothetical protein